MTTSLPQKWQIKKIGEIGKIASGGTPKSADPECFNGDIPWITPVDLSGYQDKYISRGRKSLSEKGLKTSSAKILPKNTVLFSSRAPVGYVAIAANDLTTNQGFKSVLPSPEVYHEYVYFYLKSAKKLAESMASGTTFLELSGSRFAQIPIPVPPLSTQQAIVSRIDQLFSQLDDGEKALRHAEAQLARYKQAVLKASVSGELTREWREKNPTLAKPWVTLSLGEIGKTSTGTTPKTAMPEYYGGTIPFLKPTDLDQGYDVRDAREFLTAAGAEVARTVPLNAIMVTCIRATLGKTGINRFPLAAFNQQINAVVVDAKKADARWLYWVISSYGFQRAMWAASSSTTLPILNKSKFSALTVDVPPLAEQLKIVEHIEIFNTEYQHLAAELAKFSKHSATLRQSILHAAFSGQLVKEPTA